MVPDQRLIDQLKRHEGLRLEAYRCPAGRITIGYGHNLEAHPVEGIPTALGSRISPAHAETLLRIDTSESINKLLDRLPWTSALDAVRFSVLVNMAFNLGIAGLAAFSRTLQHVQRHEYSQAADEMLDSMWARQVGARAEELAAQMRTGEWEEG